MAYNETIANRIREALIHEKNVEEKLMFGGICFMINDKMCMGVIGDDMMCRIDPDIEATALEKHGCRPMDFTNRPMKGYVYVDETGISTNADLTYWVDLCLAFNPKAKKSAKKK